MRSFFKKKLGKKNINAKLIGMIVFCGFIR